jgi:hypothetical protein
MKEIEEVKLILDKFYEEKTTYKLLKGSFFLDKIIYNGENGLGDNLILTSVSPFIKVKSDLLSGINSKFIDKEFLTDKDGLHVSELSLYNWGGGHCIQRLQKSLGLNVEKKPKPKITYDPKKKISGKVFVHLSNNTDWKRNIPNSLEDENIEEVNNFFLLNGEYHPYYFNNDLNIDDLISIMETCEYFLGIDSGPMHLAAAMDVKSVIIINDPQRLIYLPKIKECELPNAEWLYPQNVHLNRCGETELVPILSADNILKSISGLVYPYWSEKFLDLYS